MTGIVSWLAALYVALLPVGRSGLPMNAQWGDLVLPLLALALFSSRPSRPWFRREDWPLALYLLVTAATAASSEQPSIGFAHLAKQISVVLIFVVFRQLTFEPGLTRILARIYVVTITAVTALSIALVFLRYSRGTAARLGAVDALPFLGLVRRLRGGFVTPEMLGNALLVAFVLALGLRAGRRNGGRGWLAVAALLFAGEFLTFSHSVAGFAVAAVMFVDPSLPSRLTRVVAWTAAASVILAVNAASVVEPGPARNGYGVGPVSVNVLGASVEGELIHYAALKQVAWSAFLDHPLTGVGPGRFPVVTERAFQEGRFNARYRNKPAQCDLLGRLAESGIPGGISLVLLWVSWIRLARSASESSIIQRAAFAALVGLFINSINADVMNFRFLWIVAAWATTSPGQADADEGGPEPTRRGPTPAA